MLSTCHMMQTSSCKYRQTPITNKYCFRQFSIYGYVELVTKIYFSCSDILISVRCSFTSWTVVPSSESYCSIVEHFIGRQYILFDVILTLSIHLILVLPLILLPCIFHRPSSSLFITCPYHFDLHSWTVFATRLLFNFFILSNFVIPHIHLIILISAISNLFSCAFFNAHVSVLHTSSGLTTVLYTFPLMCTFTFLSHNMPQTLLPFYHPFSLCG